MKRIFFTLCLLVAYTLVYAQPGFLAPTNGGAGTLSSFQAASNTLTSAVTVPGTPIGKLVKGNDGLFYGMTRNGGASGKGSIFSFNSTTSVLTTVKSFNTTDGENPAESLLLGVGGKLFGMTTNGGANNMGVIFSYAPSTGVYEKLFDFSGGDGANPNGSLTTGLDRRLYGLTTFGGDDNHGVIFSIDTTTLTQRVIKSFTGGDGSQPQGGLKFASDGLFYGTTLHGGAAAGNGGVIFSYEPFGNSYTVVRNMDVTADGGSIYGDLTEAPDGKLYGMASVGGIFSVELFTGVFNWVRPFGPGEGSNANGNLTLSSDGKLYGMTPNGGASGLGTVFSYNPSNGAFAFTSFNGVNGNTPNECSLLESQPCQAPILTCPPAQTLCTNPSGNYTIPPLQLSPFCGSVLITYEVLGAVSRFGEGVNASGQFGPGVSTIRWTVIDQQSNTLFCETTVNVNGGFTATIPDGFVASPGVQPNTVYRGYLPASFILLRAIPSGPYSYTWSNGAHTPFIIVSPNVTTTYSVTITDSKGCQAVATKQVNVVDVRCGNWLDKVLVCKRINATTRTTVCVNPVQVLPLLLSGGTLGSCPPAGGGAKPTPGTNNLQLKAHPNPTEGRFVLSVSGNNNKQAILTIRSVTGKVMEQVRVQGNQVVQVGASYKTGVYVAELVQGNQRTTIKLVKLAN